MGKQKLILLTGVSGSGKTDITSNTISSYPEKCAKFTTSTNRPMRPGEIHGKDYLFRGSDFQSMIAEKKFFEYEEVYEGGFYGCEYASLQLIAGSGKIAIAPIDVKGALKFLGVIPSTAKSFVDLLFIEPVVFFVSASKEECTARIRKDNELGKRADKEDAILQRINRMNWEIAQMKHFKNVIENGNGNLGIACNAFQNAVFYNSFITH